MQEYDGELFFKKVSKTPGVASTALTCQPHNGLASANSSGYVDPDADS